MGIIAVKMKTNFFYNVFIIITPVWTSKRDVLHTERRFLFYAGGMIAQAQSRAAHRRPAHAQSRAQGRDNKITLHLIAVRACTAAQRTSLSLGGKILTLACHQCHQCHLHKVRRGAHTRTRPRSSHQLQSFRASEFQPLSTLRW